MSGRNNTLGTAIVKYLEFMDEEGKSISTCGTAERTLKLLSDHLGEEKQMEKVLAVHVAGFFKSDAANQVNGKPRASASILQIRRIVRQFLVWSNSVGYLAKIPLPKDELGKVQSEGDLGGKRGAVGSVLGVVPAKSEAFRPRI